MKRRLLQASCFGVVAVAVLALSEQRAEAGLFDFLERIGNTNVELTHYLPEAKNPCAPAPRCCPKRASKCCKPAPPKCCVPKPRCCAPRPKCCKPVRCCKPARPKCCTPGSAPAGESAPKEAPKPQYEDKKETEEKKA